MKYVEKLKLLKEMFIQIYGFQVYGYFSVNQH